MDKNRGVSLFGRTPDHIKRSMIEIPAIRAMTMLVSVHVRSNLNAMQREFAPATFQFGRSQIRILQGDGSQPNEMFRMIANYRGDMIVQDPAEIESIARFSPITEHDRHGGKHLHGDLGAFHVFDAPFR